MRIGGHHIGFRLSGRLSELRNRLARARYFRGHGVHSPFVYDIVREVFMRRELLPATVRSIGRCAVRVLRSAAPCSCRT